MLKQDHTIIILYYDILSTTYYIIHHILYIYYIYTIYILYIYIHVHTMFIHHFCRSPKATGISSSRPKGSMCCSTSRSLGSIHDFWMSISMLMLWKSWKNHGKIMAIMMTDITDITDIIDI